MGQETGISWCDHTFNPWIGCQAVSPGCDNCYAQARADRFGEDFASRRWTSAANWRQPARWNSDAAAAGVRRRVFCASLADVFDDKADHIRGELWRVIEATPHLDWLLLTKRPQNIADRLPTAADGCSNWGLDGWPNVWLGITAENQIEYDRRWPSLAEIPAAVRFLSCEPLLSEINLHDLVCRKIGTSGCCPLCLNLIDWVIAGGESGHGARMMNPAWALQLAGQCVGPGAPAFYFKQAGTRRDGRWPRSMTGKGDDPALFLPGLDRQEFPLIGRGSASNVTEGASSRE